MDKNRLATEAGYLIRLQRGLEEYAAKNYSGINPADSSLETNCKLEIIHRENGILLLYTE